MLSDSLMHKSRAFIGSILLFNSVLVPFTANAQTIPMSVSTTSTNVTSMTTNPTVQGSSVPILVPAPHIAGLLVGSTTENNLSVTLTSYNAVAAQTSPTPWITASGASSNSEVIAARSRDLARKLPYGTIIAILDPASEDNGPYCGYDSVSHLIGYRVIADTMAVRMHNKVDIMLNQYDTVPVGNRMINPAIALGACTGVTVQVVGYVNPQHIPSTQAALASMVNSSQNLAYAKF